MTTIAEKYYNNKKNLAKQASKIVLQVYNYADKLIQNEEVQQVLINKGEYRFLMTDIIPIKWESYNVAERVFYISKLKELFISNPLLCSLCLIFCRLFIKQKCLKKVCI